MERGVGRVATWTTLIVLVAVVVVFAGIRRLWIGLFEGFGIMATRDAFGLGFWLSFTMHAAAAELWLRWRPLPTSGLRTPA